MYLSHFSLNERPFSISPDPRFLFMSNRYREALAHLTYGVEDGGGFVLLTGEVGTGKTTVCRCLLQQLPDDTRLAFVLNPKLNSLELLATICDELDIPYPDNCESLKVLTDKISEYLLRCYEKGLSVVVMIDEAQNIETEVLEQIRLLTNLETNQKKLLQIILVGQPELQEKLARRELRQLAQRITARYHLRPLNLKETMAYVLHRVKIAGGRKNLFTRGSIEVLHNRTAGIPRLINTICDRALVAASSRNKAQVDNKVMNEAVSDVLGGDIGENLPNSVGRDQWLLIAGGAVAFVILMVAAFWFGRQTIPPSEVISQQVLSEDKTPVSEEKSSNDNESTREQASLLERLMADQRWDTNGNWSMQQLLALWKIEYSPLADGNGCLFAASYNLLCESGRGNWQQLREINRPAILKFSAGLQGNFWGTIEKLKGSEAVLSFGSNKVTVALDELSTIWTGEYQILWQGPSGYAGDIKMGQQGDAVSWLSEQMRLLVDGSLSQSREFDPPLRQALSEYQRRRNLIDDGIAGMKTILVINQETLDGIPLLQ
jgi:general secretion pathway protein A